MMKMLIQLDEECVKKDGKYSLGDIWQSIDGKFSPECIKEEQPDGFGAIFRESDSGLLHAH